MSVENQVAIVTGGGSGIGKACSIRLAKEGAKVVIGAMSEAYGKATCELIHLRIGAPVTFISICFCSFLVRLQIPQRLF